MFKFNYLATITCLAVPSLGWCADLKLSGTVLDSKGRPAAGAGIGTSIYVDANGVAGPWVTIFDAGVMRQGTPARSLKDGRFQLTLPGAGLPVQLQAISKDGKQAVSFRVDKTSQLDNLKIQLQPAARVQFSFKDPKSVAKDLSIGIVKLGDYGPTLNTSMGLSGTVPLPPGKYKLSAYSGLAQPIEQEFEVRASQTVKLATKTFQPNLLASLYGRQAPELSIGDAMGAEKSLTLESLRGKWVLIEFWGFWCKPCVLESIPKLIKFTEQNAAFRSKFEVLAFHESGTLGTIEALKPKLATLEATEWKRSLPFPILIDRNGETVKRYGITAYPTVLLIDPQGKIVKNWTYDQLAELIRR